jgi:hypothetical protein
MDFDHLLGLHMGTRSDPMLIADVEPAIAQSIGSKTQQVFLSAQTVMKQLRHHRELPISIYRWVAPTLRKGSYLQDGPRTTIVLYTDRDNTGYNFRAYLKTTQTGHELYLASFLKMRERDLRRELRKTYPVIRSGCSDMRKEAEAS